MPEPWIACSNAQSPKTATMIIDCAYYRGGARQREAPASVADAADRAAQLDGFVWLGVHEPTDDEMDEVATYFPVHEVAVEDARARHQRAEMGGYGHPSFVVPR